MDDSETHVVRHDAEQSMHHEPKEEPLGKELQQRKKELIGKLQKKKQWLIYIAMFAIAWFGYYIRTRNIPLLQGKWLPDVDSYAFLRYAEYIAAHGKLMAHDALRFYPFGFDPRSEFGFLSYVIAYLEKILHIFNPSATTVDAAILYPPLALFLALIFFFLFAKKLFNFKVAIVATAFLTVVPAFLYRTMAGVSDKEAIAIMFFFGAFYFYTAAMKANTNKSLIINGLFAGLFSGLTGAVWGGVQFLFLTMGTHAIVSNLFGLFEKKHIYAYSIWAIITFPVLYLFYPTRYNINTFLTSLTPQVMVFGLIVGIIVLLLSTKKFKSIKEMAEKKLPAGAFAILSAFVLGVVLLVAIKGPEVITSTLANLYEHFTKPFALSRWQITVAENHQPYFVDWIGQFTWKYILLFMAGATLVFANAIKHLSLRRTSRWMLVALCAAFLFTFSMSRYSAGSTFNGETGISQITYAGSIIVFFGVLIYGYLSAFYKKEPLFESVAKSDHMLIFTLCYLIIMLIAARSAIRLLFVLAPATAILTGYLAVESFEWSKKLKKDALKIGCMLLIVFIIGSSFYEQSKSVMTQSKYVGPSYNIQWQNAMSWVRESTPEDAIFAHWWDYGYWVQWGGQRTTISDGGNAYSGINHFVGRHVLTAQSELEALEFLKARNVSYVLMINDEIGKYPAFSSIGADRNYDRYSWISTFTMQPSQTRETRNQTVYVFTGGTPLDDDFIYKGQLFPANSAGIGAIFVPINAMTVSDGNQTRDVFSIGQPEAIVVYNGRQETVPLRCVYINGQEAVFDAKDALEGCFRVLPSYEGQNNVNPLGAGLYLSPDVYKSMFAKLFLLNYETQYFKVAYNDEGSGFPLAVYQGRLVGPLKIWQVSYPDNLVIPPEYYKNEVPDLEVEKIKQ